MKRRNNDKIGIIGLGYVGIPLAISLSKHFKICCYDVDKFKINNLKKNILPFHYKKNFNMNNTKFSFNHNILNV